MKKILSKTAFSLLELIIASVLVVIVIMGIFSVNSVLNNNSQDYGQRYFVKSETQTTLNHILNNASGAIGSATTINGSLDKGILIGANGDLGNADPTNDPNSFCIHQDIVSPPYTGSTTIDNAPINTPPSTRPYYNNSYPQTTSDSRWLCYTWYPSTNAQYPYQIWYCAMAYEQYDPINAPWRGASSCNGIASTYLGTAQSSPAVTFNVPAGSGFIVTINNYLNNSLATSSNNPQAQVSGSVFPLQEGT